MQPLQSYSKIDGKEELKDTAFAGSRIRSLVRMGRWARKEGLRTRLRRGKKACFRLGDEEHQQPQCQYPQEVLSRGPGLLAGMHTTRGREGAPSTGDM